MKRIKECKNFITKSQGVTEVPAILKEKDKRPLLRNTQLFLISLNGLVNLVWQGEAAHEKRQTF